ncbi:thymidine phosphorylase, partial [Candidatus Micrarchaeota archaeon]|nr:thymidine phosphorylase [Candidatus Micrarchaeota archaeon]
PIVVSIVVAAGLACPKTSSRSITSPAGTADTVETIAGVSFNEKEIMKIVEKTGGCMVWGGAVNLAPADDKIIQVEHPLSIDAEGQLLASIMAKKGSVSATHVLIDIPVGKTAKVKDAKHAKHLKQKFLSLGKKLGMKMEVMVTDGSEPIGNGVGPALEMKDVLYVMKNDERQPLDLREKCLKVSGVILEMTKKAPKGKGYRMAKKILDSGKAFSKMKEILSAQGGKLFNPDKIEVCPLKYDYKSKKSGRVKQINNESVSKIARVAGAPKDKCAGVYLYKHVGDSVKKGDKLFTIYSRSRRKLRYASDIIKMVNGYIVG